MRTPDFTRYSVASSRAEIRRQRRGLTLGWFAVGSACAVIVVFAYLLLTGLFA